MLTPNWTGPDEVTFASSGMASIVQRVLSSERADGPQSLFLQMTVVVTRRSGLADGLTAGPLQWRSSR